MSTRYVVQGLGTMVAGFAVAAACWKLRESDAYLTRTIDALSRRRMYSEGDRAQLTRGMRFALGFGVGMGGLFVLIGVVTLFAR